MVKMQKKQETTPLRCLMSLTNAFKWESGRQNATYWKMRLFESKWLKSDAYLLKIAPNVDIPWHVDSCPYGFKHNRILMRIGKHACGDFLIYEDDAYHEVIKLPRFCLRLFDARNLHSLTASNKETLFLSFGWLSKL